MSVSFAAQVPQMRQLESEQVLSFTMEIADRLLVLESGRLVHEVARAECDADEISRYLAV